jgi:hypothetical protein
MFSTKELVLMTVDHFEMNPQCYRFTSNLIPQSSYESGCVLGWMAHFAGEHHYGVLTPDVIARITGDPVSACDVGDNDFFKRLDKWYPSYYGSWRTNVTHAAAALRAYAAQYREAPVLPVWGRMRDREALAAKRCYDQFRASLDLRPLAGTDGGACLTPLAHLIRADEDED